MNSGSKTTICGKLDKANQMIMKTDCRVYVVLHSVSSTRLYRTEKKYSFKKLNHYLNNFVLKNPENLC